VISKQKSTAWVSNLLACQGYMPAQDIQVLKNPMNKNLSPWYELDVNTEIIETPEWTFNSTDLKSGCPKYRQNKNR